jgi:hypothetical protein
MQEKKIANLYNNIHHISVIKIFPASGMAIYDNMFQHARAIFRFGFY